MRDFFRMLSFHVGFCGLVSFRNRNAFRASFLGDSATTLSVMFFVPRVDLPRPQFAYEESSRIVGVPISGVVVRRISLSQVASCMFEPFLALFVLFRV